MKGMNKYMEHMLLRAREVYGEKEECPFCKADAREQCFRNIPALFRICSYIVGLFADDDEFVPKYDCTRCPLINTTESKEDLVRMMQSCVGYGLALLEKWEGYLE